MAVKSFKRGDHVSCQLEPQFNGGLFQPHHLSDGAVFEDDKALSEIVKSLSHDWLRASLQAQRLDGVGNG